MPKKTELFDTTRPRKLENYGHITRNAEKYSNFQLILRGRIGRWKKEYSEKKIVLEIGSEAIVWMFIDGVL
jgi:hypothetical protein